MKEFDVQEREFNQFKEETEIRIHSIQRQTTFGSPSIDREQNFSFGELPYFSGGKTEKK